jgi:outer membrane protein assembly complex protein YaeT
VRAFAGWAALLVLGACASAPPASQEQSTSAPDRPAAVDVEFEGNASFGAFRLRRVVADLLVDFARDPAQESPIFDAALDLEDHYRSAGFPDVRVSYRVVREPALLVVFAVEEGPRVTVEEEPRVTVDAKPKIDAAALSTEELLKLWSRQNSGLLGLGSPYFVEDDLRAFAYAIGARFEEAGYLDVRVEGPHITRAPGGTTAQVGIDVHQGELYLLGSVQLSSELLAHLPDIDLTAVGKPYEPVVVQKLRGSFREVLRDTGYPNPSVRVLRDVDREKKIVHLRVEGSLGQRARIGAIRIQGHERTADSVIENRVEFAVGEWFNGKKIDETVENLYLTGLFSKVHVKMEEGAPGQLVTTIEVEEAAGREISFLGGYGSYEELRGGVFFTDHNVLGLGQNLRVAGKVSFKSHGADATWTEPQLFGTDNTLSVTTFFKEREEPSFTDTSYGASTALSRRLFEHAQLRVGYGYAQRDGSDVDPSLEPLENEFDIGSVFTELARDDRDSQIYPTSGNREVLRYEVASDALGGSIDFHRLTGEASWYLPLAEEWVFGLSARTGVIWPGDGELPVQERFYNGGESTVRSFRESELGPFTPAGEPAGGEFRNVFNAELRFPIIMAFKGAVFADAGNVGSNVEDYGLGDMRYGVGFGLRLALPIGPVRFDVAWNPDPEPQERSSTLHLTVGLPF